jgi:hypothetical protein
MIKFSIVVKGLCEHRNLIYYLYYNNI